MLKEKTGNKPSVGALHSAMYRLEEKRCIKSNEGGATAERGKKTKAILQAHGLRTGKVNGSPLTQDGICPTGSWTKSWVGKMKQQDSPKWASKLLGWYCRKELFDFIYGDLLEIYDNRIIKKGKFKADSQFVLDVFSLFRPFALKGTRINSNKYAMLENYLKVAFRNSRLHKLYSSIKIGGLGLGIAACILISLFIKDEPSYDQGFENTDQIYRIVNTRNRPGEEVKWIAQEPPMLGVIENEMPEVEAAGRVVPYGRILAGSNLFRRSDQTQNNFEDGFIYADHSILEVFDLSLTYGDRKCALTLPASIMLTRYKVDQYFPGQNPFGQTVIFNDDSKPYKIDGVIAGLPEKTHFTFESVITLVGEEMWPGEHLSLCCNNFDIYMKIRVHAGPASVAEQLYNVRDTYMTDYISQKVESILTK